MKSVSKKLMVACLSLMSVIAIAAPPAAAQPVVPQKAQMQWGGDGPGKGTPEEHEKRGRMMLVVGMAEALNLTEVEALRLSDKLKGFDERRRPIREQMREAMQTLKAAADVDAAAGAKVDAATQQILDGRQSMAALDKDMFQVLSKDLTPQKRAQLALFLARFSMEMRGGKHGGEGHGGKGRHHFKQ